MSEKTVLITGASTGIGRACALELSTRGYRVFAAVRKQSDGEALLAAATSGARIEPVVLDVADYASVRAAAQVVEAALGAAALDGLVNNAGISVSGPLELLPMELFDRQMQVNVNGQLAVTQAFLPLLRRSSSGRIVFIGSESGRFTLPLLGAYSASKHAVEALGNALRLELRRFGIFVSIIEAGSIKSEIWNKADSHHEALLAAVPRVSELYGNEVSAMVRMPKQVARTAAPASAVVKAVLHALTANSPKARYWVGADAHVLIPFFALMPTWLADFFVLRGMRAFGGSS